jgi:hypothetical protein
MAAAAVAIIEPDPTPLPMAGPIRTDALEG